MKILIENLFEMILACHKMMFWFKKKLTTYPTNQQNRSFQSSSWFNGRISLEYSVQNDAGY